MLLILECQIVKLGHNLNFTVKLKKLFHVSKKNIFRTKIVITAAMPNPMTVGRIEYIMHFLQGKD